LFWSKDFVDFNGQYYSFKLPSDPAKPFQINGGPPLYFGGYSDDGIELCAEFCDVYLMWPDKEENLNELIQKVKNKGAKYGRSIKFGLRIHVIVRETEDEAMSYARGLISKLSLKKGEDIKNRALDSKSLGVSIQNNLRLNSNQDFFAEPNLWTGIGLARSGCGAALVGNPSQIVSKLERYIDMGIDSFILSGYPHNKECEIFGNYVLPHFNNVSLSKQLGRFPEIKSNSPLSEGPRK
jgi:alkanesulfonate monooxygenase